VLDRNLKELEEVPVQVSGMLRLNFINTFNRKTSGRGHKGMHFRAGGQVNRGFEGG